MKSFNIKYISQNNFRLLLLLFSIFFLKEILKNNASIKYFIINSLL